MSSCSSAVFIHVHCTEPVQCVTAATSSVLATTSSILAAASSILHLCLRTSSTSPSSTRAWQYNQSGSQQAVGQAVARGTARYVFDFVANALIGLDLRVLALVGASCDADRDCDAARAGELLVSVPCARLILTTSPCSFNLCTSSTSPRGYLVCPNVFNIHHPELLADSGLQCAVPSTIFAIARVGEPGNKREK